jgi:uncharacterized membrane protein YjfL (UPF0719 family)
MRSELRELIRYANIALAMTVPGLIVGAILLRNASEGVQQAFGLTMFFLPFAIARCLEGHNKRRRRRD